MLKGPIVGSFTSSSPTRQKLVVLPPAGSGSKGDEGIIRGLLALFHDARIVLLNPGIRPWTSDILDMAEQFEELPYTLDTLRAHLGAGYILLVLGTDVLDGSYGFQALRPQFEALQVAGQTDSQVAVFFSFRSDPAPTAVEQIRSLRKFPKIRFFLRDPISLATFQRFFGDNCCSFFPDFAFYCPRFLSGLSEDLRRWCTGRHQDVELSIGLNFSEHSFRATHASHTLENKKDYVRRVLSGILEALGSSQFNLVLISNDVRRRGQELWSDGDYSRVALDLLNARGLSQRVRMADPAASYAEVISMLEALDVLITSRMHPAVAAFRAGVIPLLLTGASVMDDGEEYDRGIFDKARGMFEWCLGRQDLVVTNEKDLKAKFKEILETRNNLKDQILHYSLERKGELSNLGEQLKKDLRVSTNGGQEIAPSATLRGYSVRSYLILLERLLFERDSQMMGFGQMVNERESQIMGLRQMVDERESQIGSIRQSLADAEQKLASIHNSRSWRLAIRLGRLYRVAALPIGSRLRRLLTFVGKAKGREKSV